MRPKTSQIFLCTQLMQQFCSHQRPGLLWEKKNTHKNPKTWTSSWEIFFVFFSLSTLLLSLLLLLAFLQVKENNTSNCNWFSLQFDSAFDLPCDLGKSPILLGLTILSVKLQEWQGMCLKDHLILIFLILPPKFCAMFLTGSPCFYLLCILDLSQILVNYEFY